jgi:hypothetical protein
VASKRLSEGLKEVEVWLIKKFINLKIRKTSFIIKLSAARSVAAELSVARMLHRGSTVCKQIKKPPEGGLS